MDIHAGFGLTGNAAAYTIDYAKNECPLLFGQLDGGQRVGRFAALADGDDHIVLFDHRIAVAELAGIFHLHTNAAHFLDELLADEPRVPGGAAGHDNHVAGTDEFGLEIVQGREVDVIRAVGLFDNAATHTILDALRLLENFLQHEVGIAAFAQGIDVEVYILHAHFSHDFIEVRDFELVTYTDICYLLIFEIDHLVRMLNERRGIAADEKLRAVLADADDEGRSLAGSHEVFAVVAFHHHDGIRADGFL